MTSIMIDIRDGLSSSVAIKGPCRVATTANITLSGEQTIDGVAVVTDDRVLVKDQTTASDNGIWVCDTGPWRRSKDFNKTRDVKTGSMVNVTSGTVGSGQWQVSTVDPITIGTTSIAFVRTIESFVGLPFPPVANTFLQRNAGNTAYVALSAASTLLAIGALKGQDIANYAGANESAKIAAMIAAAPTQPYMYRADSHFGLIRDTAPLNYQGTRASLVLQHRDTASGAINELIPGVVFQFRSTGDGNVTAVSNLSQTIWQGLISSAAKTGDGSISCFTATGELGAYGAGLYNELGGFQGEFTNTGSLHGTMSGVEVLLKDGLDTTTNFDTAMSAVIGRVRRWNAGTQRVVNFMASSEGDVAPESAYSFSPGGFATWLRGMDFRYSTFTTGQAILLKNNDSIAAMNAAGTVGVSLVLLDATDHTWLMAGGASKQIRFANSALAVQFNVLSTALAVNNFEVSGAVAGSSPLLWLKGSDTDIGSSFGTKGAGVHSFYTGGASFLKQMEIGHVATSVNWVSLKGAVTTGHPIIQPGGSDANPSIIVQGKGTGGVKINDGAAAIKFEVNTTGIGFFATAPVAAKTGWGVPTGTLLRTTYVSYAGATHTASYVQATIQALDDAVKAVSQRVAALVTDLHQTAGYGLLRT